MSKYTFDRDYRFIGEFNRYYEEVDDPWGQGGSSEREVEYNEEARGKLVDIINQLEGNVTEIGCGLGHALNVLSISLPDKHFNGVDISDVAVAKATKLFPQIEFKQGDITKDVVKDDIVLLNECLWYVLHEIDEVINNCECEYLIISTAFLTEQKYGRSIIDGWNGLLKYLIGKGKTVIHAEYDYEAEELINGIVVVT